MEPLRRKTYQCLFSSTRLPSLQWRRGFSQISSRHATLGGIATEAQKHQGNAQSQAQNSNDARARDLYSSILDPSYIKPSSKTSADERPPAHQLYIYSHRHNSHMTLMTPDQKCMITLSAGRIGFKKSSRGSYDAAFQLASYFFGQLHSRPEWDGQIKALDICLRGFGMGREAITKSILGTEGNLIRSRITSVRDATRLKFGGTRSRKMRRLG